MRLKLEALSAVDGRGIVRAGKLLRLLRPPYLLSNASVLSEQSLEDAVLRHGFFASEQVFDNWAEVIAYLNEQVVATRRSLEREVPPQIDGKDIVETAPPEILSHFMDRVEEQLIPRRLFDHVERFLLAILASEVRTRYPKLADRAVQLLQSNANARTRPDEIAAELGKRDVRFTRLERHGELERAAQLSEKVKNSGSLFLVS